MPHTLMIRNLNAPVAERLVSYAHKGDKSLDEAVKDLLAIALGVTPMPRRRRDNGLRRFRGSLSATSANLLLKHVEDAPFSKVDAEDL